MPVRIAIGPRDLENGTVELARRDTMEKFSVSAEGLVKYIGDMLDDIQRNIYAKALKFRGFQHRESGYVGRLQG